MRTAWETVKLGDVLRRSEETIQPKADTEYHEITARLWGKGIVARGRTLGVHLSGRRFVAHAGQFIVSRIDARNGAMGLIPPSLEGAVVTNDFPLFNINADRLEPEFLDWLSRTAAFVELCKRASEGTTNRVRLQEDKFLALEIPLPPILEQSRIVARIEELVAQVEEVCRLRQQQNAEIQQCLLEVFLQLTRDAPRRRMQEVAPLIRRPVEIEPEVSYPELGIRSFGKGTFHKPVLTGSELGSKRIYRIEPDDLVFMNVFAWEGAVAVAKPEDKGRYGSHRFITCVPKKDVATAHFLCFYFLTEEGLEDLRKASPGGAGRNRTLGLAALENIKVPAPKINVQQCFDVLQADVNALKRLQAETAAELDALLPSVLDRAFRGEL
jgi:type I restriction enzyme S subunit